MVATPTPAASSGPVRAPTERERAFLGASAHNTGIALLAEGKYEEAGLAFEKALDENEDALDTWSALGVCMHELGQQDAALVCQRQVRALLTALCPAARSADLAQSTPRSLTHARRCRAPQVQRIQASEAHQAAQREREAEVSAERRFFDYAKQWWAGCVRGTRRPGSPATPPHEPAWWLQGG